MNRLTADDLNDTVYRQYTAITKLNNRLRDIKTQLEMTRAEMERWTQRSEEFELYCRLFDGGIVPNHLLLCFHNL